MNMFKNNGRFSTLVSSKLQVPSVKSKMVPRTTLVNRLSSGKNYPLILIQGLAASGKTSLACQWIKMDQLVAGWYSIDAVDNEPDIFFRYLLAAFQSIDDGDSFSNKLGNEVTEHLTGSEIVAFILNQFENTAKDIYLFMDNFHLITSREIVETLLYLLDHLPSKVHLIILTRSVPPFSISQFRIQNKVIEIAPEDMPFSEIETELFFKKILSVNVSTDQVSAINRYTGGWVGGIQLFKFRPELESPSTGTTDLSKLISEEAANYLVDEIFNAQSERIKEFFQATAFLNRFNVDLCREIVGGPDIQGIIDHLYGNHLFMVPLDTARIWYGYQPVFSEAIRAMVLRSNSAFADRVHKRAASWFFRNNYLKEAFEYAFASHDNEFAADIIEDSCVSLFDRDDLNISLPWLWKLPRNTLLKRPLLRLSACIMDIESLQLDEIGAMLSAINENPEKAFARYKGMKKTLCFDMLGYLKCLFPFYRDQVYADKKPLDEITSYTSLKDKLFAGIMKVNLARCYFLQGDFPLAATALDEASTVIMQSHSPWARMLWSKVASDVERFQGRLYRAEAILNEGFLFLERKGISDAPLASMCYLPMAWIYYFRNDLEKALEFGTIALKYMEKNRTVNFVIEGSILLLFVYAAMHDVENMDICLQRLNKVSKATGNPNLIVSVNACIAYPHIAHGRLERLQRWTNRRKESTDPPFSMTLLYEKMVQAGLLYRKERYREAVEHLEALRAFCEKRNMMLCALDTDLMLAAALYKLGDHSRAMDIIEKALSFSEAEWCIRPFAAYAPIIAPIVSTMAGTLPNRMNTSFMAAIMDACNIEKYCPVRPNDQKGTFEESLTPRESEILSMMADGLTNKQIADKAFISLDTVKTHGRHIYEKLNVKTRVQAIRKANELKILSIS